MTTAMERTETRRIPQDSLPLRLVMLRHECDHISQRQAAFRCGITPRVWQGMEEGRNTANLLDVLRVIADEFGYDLDWLAWGGPLERKNPRHPEDDGGVGAPSRARTEDLRIKSSVVGGVIELFPAPARGLERAA